jgi:hypothetical protein
MARKTSSKEVKVAVQGQGQAAAPAPAKRHRTSRVKPAEQAAAPVQDDPASLANLAQAVDPSPTAQAAQVDEHDVARLAYSFWVERGYQGGSPEDDWFRALQALRGAAAK